MDTNKLLQYSFNKISDSSEIEEIVLWIEASDENKAEYNRIKNLWAYSEFANFDELSSSTNERKPKRKIFQLEIFKYAAIFVLAFLIGGSAVFFINGSSLNSIATNEVIVPLGESAEVILPDKTHVWLNSGTRIKYPSNFNAKSRDIELEGEAFFDVEHNPNLPFHVKTAELTVEVLGTSFNVEAISDDEEINVTLVEGRVNLLSKRGKYLAKLKPHQNANYSVRNKNINIGNVNVEFYTSWTKGVLMFKKEKLVDIAKKLERWYNVRIQFDHESVKFEEFTGTILKNKPIDQILEIIKFTSGIDYSLTIKNDEPSIIHLKKKLM